MTITAAANTNNITFESSVNNLLVTNDLTTGNILFTSERHNIQPQVLGTLIAEEDARSTPQIPRIRIKRMNEDGTVDRILIRRKAVWRFFCQLDGTQAPSRVSLDADGPTQLQAVLDYLNNLFTEVPATTSTILDFGPDDTLDAAREATNTTVLFDNGKEHAVNAIIAVQNEVGFIDVVDHATAQIHFRNIRHDKVTINGSDAGNTVIGVVNALNALFTVNPLGAGYQPTVILPTLAGTTIDYLQAEQTVPPTSDPDTGLPHLQVATGNDPHGSRLWADSTSNVNYIDQAGEYYDFKITGKGQFLLGLHEVGVDEVELNNNTGNQHYGMYWSLSLYNYGSYMGPHTIYGSSPGLAYGPGWTGAQTSRYASNQELQDNHVNGYSNLWRVGIDNNGYIYVSYFDAGRTNDFVMVARRSQVTDGTKQFGLAIKLINGNATLVDVPTRTATDPTGPSLAYRYIESPDGQFYYPLFASADEAAYVDVQNGGADPGSAHTHVFPDEPTGTIWYMPSTGGTHAGPSAPSNTSEIIYTEIPTLADDQFGPAAYTGLAISQNENTTINLQVEPQGVNYTTTVDENTLPPGITFQGGHLLQGTLPYVPADTTYNVSVTRTNSYGSTTGTQQITVLDNAAVSAIGGWTVHQGNTVSPNVVKSTHPSVLEYNTLLSPGKRVRIPFSGIMKFGIPNASGIANRETVDIFDKLQDNTEFDLLVTIWEGGAINPVSGVPVTGAGIGWVDNSPISQPGHQNSDVYFLEYRDDNKFYLINNDSGEVLLESAAAYGGDVPLYYGTPAGYTQDKIVPSVTVEDIGYQGDAIAGYTMHPDSTPLQDASTMTDGNVVALDETVTNNHRLIIRKEWIEQNISAGLQNATGTSQFFIGIPAGSADFTSLTAGNGNVAAEDFSLAIGIAQPESIRGTSWKLKMYKDGAQVHDIGIGGTGTNAIYDVVFSNVDGRWEMSIQNNFGTPVPTDAAIALRQIDGGTWSQTVVHTGIPSASETIYFGAQNTTATLSLTGLEVAREPFLLSDILVGESSTGNSLFAQQPASTTYDEAPNGHAPNSYTNNAPSLAAGQTYRFIYHPSMEGTDDFKLTLASDGSDYTTGVTYFGSGDPTFTSDYKGFTFVVPSDVPPLNIAYKNSYQGNTAYNNVKELPISGSTYTVDINGINILGPNSSGSLITAPCWLELDEQLSAGERLVLNAEFLEEVAAQMGSGYKIYFGLKSAGWSTSSDETNGFEQGAFLWINSYYGAKSMYAQGINGYGYRSIGNNTKAMLEITSSGNNIRAGVSDSGGFTTDAETTAYADWEFNLPKAQSGDQGYGITSRDVVVYFKASGAFDLDTANIDWSRLFEVAVPTPPPAILTPFTKALDFSGSAERAQQVSTSGSYNPVMMGNLSSQVALPSTPGYTTPGSTSMPWAVSCVFKLDQHNSNQHIWNVGEGSGSTDDNIYLRVDANRNLYFGWGRSGSLNEIRLTADIGTSHWYGVYIASNGARLGASNATNNNLGSAFDIRFAGSHTNWTLSNNLSTPSHWATYGTSVGGRMDRQITGATTIGGRGANRSFHGQIASTVITTLRRGQAMPGDAEIKEMLTDPVKWLQDYKIGQLYRLPYSNTEFTFQLNESGSAYGTQVWLMGDGPNDAFAQIRNHVYPSIQNIYPMNMISMTSNDIVTVNIPGLT